jgi:hypothetical protein
MTAPHTAQWNTGAAGTYTFTERATDNAGATNDRPGHDHRHQEALKRRRAGRRLHWVPSKARLAATRNRFMEAGGIEPPPSPGDTPPRVRCQKASAA